MRAFLKSNSVFERQKMYLAGSCVSHNATYNTIKAWGRWLSPHKSCRLFSVEEHNVNMMFD